MIVYCHADPRVPFFQEDARQPAARWHREDEGPVQYVADTPDGAWAEFLRHEDIREPQDLATVRRALWAIEIEDGPAAEPHLPRAVLRGGLESYAACRAEATRLRAAGAARLDAPSAALDDARGFFYVRGVLTPGTPRPPHVIILFGIQPAATGWRAVHEGRPHEELLRRVRYL